MFGQLVGISSSWVAQLGEVKSIDFKIFLKLSHIRFFPAGFLHQQRGFLLVFSKPVGIYLKNDRL
jgi:hypothetical protein